MRYAALALIARRRQTGENPKTTVGWRDELHGELEQAARVGAGNNCSPAHRAS